MLTIFESTITNPNAASIPHELILKKNKGVIITQNFVIKKNPYFKKNA